ncbi:MAG: hypothetical protein WC505_06150 [Patescibacteria group bacterium]
MPILIYRNAIYIPQPGTPVEQLASVNRKIEALHRDKDDLMATIWPYADNYSNPEHLALREVRRDIDDELRVLRRLKQELEAKPIAAAAQKDKQYVLDHYPERLLQFWKKDLGQTPNPELENVEHLLERAKMFAKPELDDLIAVKGLDWVTALAESVLA